ncbi:recombinase family protein [Aestuariicoccus sp. MJ-SS9]|uniref:recombinase family protein n=1 Tax=Aestuariicoccus sp. MJ-SS9 TaxID=3079855 RepID=UPI002909CF0E|nr:recombinase family protein [Aestuariicoccus sp. MJ-SS9]MDU8912502.1 recombinase family protein [Aestuariicoccus sp. MJ-SS9]
MTTSRIRCAIYTRKSSEEGLDQDFNSLDAQHEACAAYIASQRHEGWKALSVRYDDGGISGGTMERPALARMLAEIDARRIDMVVVYKIDRLTRSLADFAKLVERMEAANCSFVSVTQAFNTSSSMGRLTLNVLLSFAQFEREVTAERIRDKIAASKKKGLWMGGIPPLGYDGHPDPMRRELVVNETEAEVVTTIFELYDRHACLNTVVREAARLDLRSKQHHFSTGRVQGGNALTRGQIYHLLTNPVYLGQIRHKKKTWPGTHPAVIEQTLWDRVQDRLVATSARRRGAAPGTTLTSDAPLKGKLRDETGDTLTPTHTNRHGKRLRYYVSNRLITGGPDPSGWRLSALALEAAVARIIAGHLSEAARRHAVLNDAGALASSAAAQAVQALAEEIGEDGVARAAPLISSIAIGGGQLAISLDRTVVSNAAGLPADDLVDGLLFFEAPFTCKRRGVEMKIVAGDLAPTPDPTLLRGLRNAQRWTAAIKTGTTLSQLAETERLSARYIARVIPLSGLSPKIQAAIVAGSQPPDLTLERLVRKPLPLAWDVQERMFGIGN